MEKHETECKRHNETHLRDKKAGTSKRRMTDLVFAEAA
jgi:hypothetical protein